MSDQVGNPEDQFSRVAAHEEEWEDVLPCSVLAVAGTLSKC